MMRTITISSGKGGVGKTTLSLNLALQLARLGYRTCLFDADLGLANVNVLLGLYPEYNLEDVILDCRSLEDVIIRDYAGIDIIPGSSGVEKLANLEEDQIACLVQSFSTLNGYDFLLFDTSAGISRSVISFCLASSEVLLVVTPEIPSLTDAYALLKILCLNGFKGTVRVVVNQCSNLSVARHTYAKFKKTVKKYLHADVVSMGMIAEDPKVEEAIREQKAFILLYPESAASKCIRSIAKHLVDEKSEGLETLDIPAFWTKSLELITTPLKLSSQKKEKRAAIDKTPPEPRHPVSAQGLIEDKHIDNLLASDEPQVEKRRDIFSEIDTSRNLPTLAHVVLKLIKACSRESPISDICDIVKKDASLSAKVFSVVNSSRSSEYSKVSHIEEAVSVLGRNVLRAIAFNIASQVAFDGVENASFCNLKRFWQHSLMCATLSKLIAEKTSYPWPGEAFSSGLLHDIGKLILLVNFSKEYGEIVRSYSSKPDLFMEAEKRLGAAHNEVGAWLINQWNLQSFMADAVLYHHQPVHSILESLPLVKIVFVANVLCDHTDKDNADRFESAKEVFGFERSYLEEIISLADQEVRGVAASLEIEPIESVSGRDVEKQKDLARIVRGISMVQGTLQNLLVAPGEVAILQVIEQGLRVLFDVNRVLFFLYDPQTDTMVGRGTPSGDNRNMPFRGLILPLQEGGSLLARSFREEVIVDSFGYPKEMLPTIIDKQLMRLLGKDGMLCLPMVSRGQKIGAITLGTDEHHILRLRDQACLLTMLADYAALALSSHQMRQSELNRLRNVIRGIQNVLDNEKSHGYPPTSLQE